MNRQIDTVEIEGHHEPGRSEMIEARIEDDRFYDAIRAGVADALWRMITNSTSTPCKDFYAAIEDAAREAFTRAMKS